MCPRPFYPFWPWPKNGMHKFHHSEYVKVRYIQFVVKEKIVPIRLWGLIDGTATWRKLKSILKSLDSLSIQPCLATTTWLRRRWANSEADNIGLSIKCFSHSFLRASTTTLSRQKSSSQKKRNSYKTMITSPLQLNRQPFKRVTKDLRPSHHYIHYLDWRPWLDQNTPNGLQRWHRNDKASGDFQMSLLVLWLTHSTCATHTNKFAVNCELANNLDLLTPLSLWLKSMYTHV